MKEAVTTITHLYTNCILQNAFSNNVKLECAGIETLLAYMDEFFTDKTVYMNNYERKLALAWFVREYGPCWRQLTLVACVFNYFNTGGTEM